MKNRLTGNFYHKKTIFGFVLMVGYWCVVSDFAGDDSPDVERFRKATEEDLLSLNYLK